MMAIEKVAMERVEKIVIKLYKSMPMVPEEIKICKSFFWEILALPLMISDSFR